MSQLLLVEDSPTQALVATKLLEGAGYTVRHAASVAEAMEACSQAVPDLIILDQHLGEEPGLEVCRQIKGDIALQLIPVLVLTGSASERDQIDALDAGADRFLSKDSPHEELLTVVRRLLQTMLPAEAIIRDAETQESFLRGARILAVDDSRTFLDQLGRSLAKSGLQVTCSTSGPEALDLLAEKSFDVGVVDIVTPGIDGLEVCRRARQWAETNQKQMVQLLQNLVDNAIKFRSDRKPEIEVTAEPVDDGWQFSVRDNGIGIPERHLESLFVAFRRLHTRDKFPGTGVGLAICKRIVELHNGRIWVESEPGQGSTFRFTLPTTPRSAGI